MEVDHDLVVVDEFDALFVPFKPASPGALQAAREKSPPSLSDKDRLRIKKQHDGAWLIDKEKLGKYPAKAHAQKVAKELGVQSGLIFLPGQDEKLYEESDEGPEFRQRRHFFYLSGAGFPECSLTYDIARDHLILWIPHWEPRYILYNGSPPSIDDCKAESDVDDVRIASGLDKFLYMNLAPGSTLFVLNPDQTPKLGSTKGVVNIDTVKLKPAIEAARVIKDDYEVAMIRRANSVSSTAHRAVLSRIKKLSNEREIEIIFRSLCIAQGAKRQAYGIIAGSGVNASTLHYNANNSQLDGRQVVVLDAGAEWNCYASDITRTFPISGTWSPEAAAIHSIVERMQNECIQRIRPGVVYYTLHLHACIVAVTELLRLGILCGGTAADIFNRGTVAAFFPHGLGHHVGLEVHDVAGPEKLLISSGTRASWERRRASKRECVSPEMLALMCRDAVNIPSACSGRQKLAKNMVVTIEPGIYFCREYIESVFLTNPLHSRFINTKVLDRYYPVGGVRIEDCILVTNDGYENLTSAPKGDDMLRVINSGSAAA
ncbi:peptidase M24, structural domain-containing protein [Lasiosphaeria miniovina]|uniref:Xaa-Pro aminopeptidase n=1 Tax=Lasiosphaeria miniovina TaxID=1954250 RepID=A0AA40AVL7_9PEZI|nr:peptidase M24, structural domain-containing protein [Lasiosphaeria miniovina]KAK0722850.1 peptidase M24, structural domain-containing protein [Lasiosphaeria miniovina]